MKDEFVCTGHGVNALGHALEADSMVVQVSNSLDQMLE
jgi:hypothetical protein